MPNGIKALRQIQMSREDSASQGTATTDYIVWRGIGTLQDNLQVVFPEEDIGVLSGTDRTYVPKTGGTLELESIEFTFEQGGYIFDSAIALATPTTDASSAFIRTYTFPELSSDARSSTDLQTISFLAGDNNEVEAMSFSFVPSFSLSGVAGEAVKINATFEGREVSTSAAFATVTIPTIEDALFSKGRLYSDDTTDTIGTTELSNTMLAMQLDVTTGWQSVDAAAGRTDFAFIKQIQPEVMATITFEHNTNGSAEKSYWRAQTARLLQARFDGSALATTDAGATYDTKTLIANLAGKWESFEKIGEQNGNDIIVGTFRARYNSDSAQFAEFILVNETESL
jgi:hypothetical protein